MAVADPDATVRCPLSARPPTDDLLIELRANVASLLLWEFNLPKIQIILRLLRKFAYSSLMELHPIIIVVVDTALFQAIVIISGGYQRNKNLVTVVPAIKTKPPGSLSCLSNYVELVK